MKYPYTIMQWLKSTNFAIDLKRGKFEEEDV